MISVAMQLDPAVAKTRPSKFLGPTSRKGELKIGWDVTGVCCRSIGLWPICLRAMCLERFNIQDCFDSVTNNI